MSLSLSVSGNFFVLVSLEFYQVLKSFNSVSGCLKFQGCLKEVLRMFQEIFRSVYKNFQGSFKGVYKTFEDKLGLSCAKLKLS